MARPQHYKHGTVSLTLSLSGDAEAQLRKHAKATDRTLSATASGLILAYFDKLPQLRVKPNG
jgi:hypothetical protein